MSAPNVRTPGCNPADAEKNTDTQSIPPACFLGNREKEFATLQAQFALTGHALHRSRDATGIEAYLADRWGLVRYLPSLDDARRFLAQIGGAA